MHAHFLVGKRFFSFVTVSKPIGILYLCALNQLVQPINNVFSLTLFLLHIQLFIVIRRWRRFGQQEKKIIFPSSFRVICFIFSVTVLTFIDSHGLSLFIFKDLQYYVRRLVIVLWAAPNLPKVRPHNSKTDQNFFLLFSLKVKKILN